jgi:hypothetical protein
MRRISWLLDELSSSQEWLCFMELVSLPPRNFLRQSFDYHGLQEIRAFKVCVVSNSKTFVHDPYKIHQTFKILKGEITKYLEIYADASFFPKWVALRLRIICLGAIDCAGDKVKGDCSVLRVCLPCCYPRVGKRHVLLRVLVVVVLKASYCAKTRRMVSYVRITIPLPLILKSKVIKEETRAPKTTTMI